ncbi:peroxisome biogenesis factor 10-like [Dreissena polymorpha]|uniref:RING-type E3 ubiquitin transferase n=1 Tax=Dreissena polymorpha TaxID=45954 RepID=A0A9D4FNB0_DREPO|nr:peroxisome biogenesis factor 10-like [Dreissena polymorpha]KAH3801998.1 hypothetical protein DPMN_155664 [Dreissena polymorpha]
MFKVAGKAGIIRSQQKDEYYLTYLRKMSADVVHSLLGARAWITWRRELDLAADLGYFCLTTLSGFQTIGEEYVNIIQVDSFRRHVPSVLHRLTMVLFHVLIPYTIRKGLDWLERRLQSHGLQEVPIATREFLLKCIPIARDLVLYTHTDCTWLCSTCKESSINLQSDSKECNICSTQVVYRRHLMIQ